MKQRLINCDFLNTEAFNDKISNKAKLLYYTMFINGDDRGFVGNTNSIISILEKNDDDFVNQVNLSLMENNYQSSLIELINMGYLYEFMDNHNNRVHLIRHWFVHNKFRKGLWTNYGSFLKLVEIKEGKYVLKESDKENNINESNINEIKLNENKVNEVKMDGAYKYESLQDFLFKHGATTYDELSEAEKEEWQDYIMPI